MSTQPAADPATAPPLSNESDIGSGEKTPGQLETENLIRQIPPLPPGGGEAHADTPAAGKEPPPAKPAG
jgi:hypothetical protein